MEPDAGDFPIEYHRARIITHSLSEVRMSAMFSILEAVELGNSSRRLTICYARSDSVPVRACLENRQLL